MIFALAVRQCTLIDPDLWWHLQTGQDIFQSRSIPSVDPYSFTKASSEWVTHEWLSELLIYGIFRLAGWAGLVSFFSGLITLALVIAYRRCEGRPYVAALALLLATASSSPLFGVRPQMITFLFASIYIAFLYRYANNGEKRNLWYFAPMMFLWVNLHAGFALGLGLIGLFIVKLLLDRKCNLVPALALVLIACTAVVPLNPNGFRMFSYPLETLTSPSMARLIQEWASPDFHQAMFIPFALLLFTLLGALALSQKQLPLGDLFLLTITGLGALRSGRHIPIFALIAAPVVASHVWSIISARGWEKRFTGADSPAAVTALAFNMLFLFAPVTLATVRLWDFTAHRPKYEAIKYPVAAVDFLSKQRLSGSLFNEYVWGGYLINRLYPDYRVYIDGRADVYGDAFMTETFDVYAGRPGWKTPLERRNVGTVIIAPDAALATLLRVDAEWKKVYEDDQAVIFSKDLSVPSGSNQVNRENVPQDNVEMRAGMKSASADK